MEFKLNQTAALTTICSVFIIFICQSVSAQNEDVSKLKNQEINKSIKLYLQPFSTELHPDSYGKHSFQKSSNQENTIFALPNDGYNTKITLTQIKTEDKMQGLGSYEFYNNNLIYRINSRLLMNLGIGLLRQNSILYPAKPNYQIGFHALLEFAVTSKLDGFIYGQYLTSPINKSKDFFDPMIYNNPLFMQSEVGAGIKRNYKNVNTKFQINSIYDNQQNQFAPVNSKITIGF